MVDCDRSIESVQKAERSAAGQAALHSLALLRGFIRRGLPHTKYLDESEERDARRVLVRLLCSDTPLDREVRYALAALFDPDDAPTEHCKHLPYVPNARKLVFKFRGRSRRTDHVRNTAIAQHVFRTIQDGKSWEEAIEDVANKFDLSDGTVRDIWLRSQWAKQLGLL